MNLSIIITFFNKGELLINAINSVNTQLNREDEIIIIDDCSTDFNSLSHLKKVKQELNNIKFIHNEFNQGSSESKNIGIRNAKNEIIVLLDADDTLPPNSINVIREAFMSNKEIDVLFGNYFRFEMDRNTKENVDCSIIVDKYNSINSYVLAEKWLLLGTSPFKKELHQNIGGFNKLYPRTDDRDFYINAIVNKAKFYYTSNHIYNWHRYSNGNNSNIPSIDSAISFFRNIMFYYEYCTRIRFSLVLFKNVLKIIFLNFNKKR